MLADYFGENPTYAKAFTFMSMDYGIESPVTGYDECRSAVEEMLIAVLGGEDAQAQLDMTVELCNEYLALTSWVVPVMMAAPLATSIIRS